MPTVTSEPATVPNRRSTKWPTVCEQATKIPNPTTVLIASDHQECHALVVDEPDQRPRRRRFGRQVEFTHSRPSNAAICSRVTVSASASRASAAPSRSSMPRHRGSLADYASRAIPSLSLVSERSSQTNTRIPHHLDVRQTRSPADAPGEYGLGACTVVGACVNLRLEARLAHESQMSRPSSVNVSKVGPDRD